VHLLQFEWACLVSFSLLFMREASELAQSTCCGGHLHVGGDIIRRDACVTCKVGKGYMFLSQGERGWDSRYKGHANANVSGPPRRGRGRG